MNAPLHAGIVVVAIAGAALALAGCGGDQVVSAVTVSPDGAASAEISVPQGSTFTVALKVSPEQAKKGVSSWARDEDNATPLATEQPAAITGTPKQGLEVTFPFVAAQAGSADMGFRQVIINAMGATPLRQTATVHVTVN